MSESPTLTLAELVTRALNARLRNLWGALPARVVSWDRAKQTVDALPMVMELDADEGGQRLAKAIPVIPKVPVIFPGGGGFHCKFDLAEGDGVLLVFTSCSLDAWLEYAGSKPVDPGHARRGHLADAVAFPFLHNPRNPLEAPPTEGAVFGAEGGARVRLTEDGVFVEDASGGAVELALKSDVASVVSTFNAHTHLYNPGPGGAAPTAGPADAASAPVGTTVLKAK